MTVDALQLEKLDLRDGDIVVLRFPGVIDFEAGRRLCEHWAATFPNTKAIVLDGGATIERLGVMRTMIGADLGLYTT